MAETLRDLVVSLSLQSDNFTRNIRSVNKQIQEAESFFKLAAAGVENFEQSTAGLDARLSTLQQKLSLQREVVDQYQRALQAARDKLQECYDRQGDYANRLAEAQTRQSALNTLVAEAATAYADCRARLGESDQATLDAAAHLNELRERYAETTEEVRKLAGQCDALQRATQNAADAVSTGNSNLNKASAAVKQTEAEIDKTNQALALSNTNWRAAGESIQASQNALVSIGKQMQSADATFRLLTVDIKDSTGHRMALSGRCTCGYCSAGYRRMGSGRYIYWRCGSKLAHQYHAEACEGEGIREAELQSLIVNAFNLLPFERDELVRMRKQINEETLVKADVILKGLKSQIKAMEEAESVTDAEREDLIGLNTQYTTVSRKRAEFAARERQIRDLLERIDFIEDVKPEGMTVAAACKEEAEFYKRTRRFYPSGLVTEYADDDVVRFIERIVIYKDKVEVEFKAGVTVTVDRV